MSRELPRVEFRVGLADPLGYCCALLRTATAKGARALVCGPPALIDELDLEVTFDFAARGYRLDTGHPLADRLGAICRHLGVPLRLDAFEQKRFTSSLCRGEEQVPLFQNTLSVDPRPAVAIARRVGTQER